MGVFGGPNVSEDGLVLALDVANQKCISPLGCTGFNNAPQLVKNIISQLDTINSYNGVKLGNLNYYTVFAIDYPEGSYGGDGASRQGITPGYNVRSGGKTYDASRALHLWVWNNDTNSWVPDNYFRGFRLSGHCYDNYSGAENGYNTELQYFAEDFNTINNTFRNCTYIVMGSHRADRYNSTVRNILTDLGKPSGYIDSDYVAAPEWILVGKPGLGAGNAYGWVYENYSTNPNQVAHLNFGLPIYGNVGNYLEFDGSDDYVDLNTNNIITGTNPFTFEAFYKVTNASVNAELFGNYGSGYTSNTIWISGRYGVYINTPVPYFQGYPLGVGTYHMAFTRTSAGACTLYKNGAVDGTSTSTTSITAGQNFRIGSDVNGIGEVFGGELYSLKVYNRALTAAEISQNYNALRGRFGI